MATPQVWDEIAEGWYRLRRHSRFPGELREVARRWGGGRMLNIGCGHGADFLPFREGFELWGADFSRRLLELGRSYQQDHSVVSVATKYPTNCLSNSRSCMRSSHSFNLNALVDEFVEQVFPFR